MEIRSAFGRFFFFPSAAAAAAAGVGEALHK
jgi:hypothetical protein